jgi:hypothetical protein
MRKLRSSPSKQILKADLFTRIFLQFHDIFTVKFSIFRSHDVHASNNHKKVLCDHSIRTLEV